VNPLYPNQNHLKNKNGSTKLSLKQDVPPSSSLMTEEETSINETLTMRNTNVIRFLTFLLLLLLQE
jgi:hypothetical protein